MTVVHVSSFLNLIIGNEQRIVCFRRLIVSSVFQSVGDRESLKILSFLMVFRFLDTGSCFGFKNYEKKLIN